MTHPVFKRLALFATFALCAPLAHAQAVSEAQQQLFAENMTQADADGDGMLDRSEFEALIRLNAEDDLGRASMIVRSERFGTAFERVDANGDGVVTASEIQALVQQL